MSTQRFDPYGPITPGSSLLEASAGTGKTYSIAGLACRLIAEEGLSIRELLVVTFTRAAAKELRARVRSRLRQRALHADTPPIERRRLGRALDDYDAAVITTIHGFCARVLQTWAFESGAEFDLELLEDTQALNETVARDFYINQTVGLAPLTLRTLAKCHFNPSELVNLAQAVERGAARVYPALVERPVVPDAALADAIERFRAAWRAGRDAFVESIRQQAAAGVLQMGKYSRDKLAERLAQIEGLLDRPIARDDKMARALRDLSSTGLQPYKARAAELQIPALAADVQVMRDAYGAAGESMLALANALRREFLDYAERRLGHEKDRAAQQSYQDLLSCLQQRLEDPDAGVELRDALRARFKATLIDEFQDTDPVQWAIFHTAFADAGIPFYLVGDPKQSIYRFRGADINAYRAAANRADNRFYLDVSWRADGPLLRALDTLFSAAPRDFLGPDIAVTAVSPAPNRAMGLDWDQPTAPLHFRRLRTPPGLLKPLPKADCVWAVTAQVVADIVDILRDPPRIRCDGAKPRALNAGDMAVLTNTNAQARAVRAGLLAVGVPAVCHGGDSVFAQPEATALLTVLLAVQQPNNKNRVRAALTTPLMGLSGSQLSRLERSETGWDAAVTTLRRARDTWEEAGFMRAFRFLLEAGGAPVRLGARADGERQLANLRHLAERLHHTCLEEQLGLHGGVAWLHARVTANADRAVETDADRLRLESDAPAVQVVTIHAAKGLEYAVSFVPFLWDAKDFHSNDQRCLVGNAPEPPYRLYLDIDLAGGPDRAQRLEQCKAAHRAENHRLLYVALTRARHHTVVYLAPYSKVVHSPLAGVLGAGPGALSLKTDDGLEAALAGLFEQSGGTITASAFELGGATTRSLIPTAGQVWARDFRRRRFDTWWRRTSFTQLKKGPDGPLIPESPTRGAIDEPDMDEQAEGSAITPVPLADFERSARFGDVIHDALEHHDFRAGAAALGDHLATQIARHRLPKADAEALAQGLQLALETPLAAGFRLVDLAPADTLRELAFHIPLAGGEAPEARGWLTSGGLARVFDQHRAPGGPLTDAAVASIRGRKFYPVQGYLCGVMDLVARHDGRYYLIDYKSSYLGPHAADYTPSALAAHMARHQYLLQYHLYLVALHRHLARRVPGYRYAEHFGGVMYLFVRGMVGDAATGVFEDQPPEGLVRALSDHFERPRGAQND